MLLLRGVRSCFCICRHCRSLSRPQVDFACTRRRFRVGFCRTHRGRHAFRTNPGCRDDCRRADSFQESYTWDQHGRGHGASASPGSTAPLTAKPFSDRISTRTRRRTATAASNAPPAVDCGPDGAPRPSARCANTPRRIPRPRPAPPTAAAPAPATSPVPTVPIPSDCDRIEPVGTPLLRRKPPLGNTPIAPTEVDALGNAAKFLFADSVARYSHADWEQERRLS